MLGHKRGYLTMARKPKEKAEISKPAILRSVRLGNGDVYGPGEEDEFLEALQAAADAAEEDADQAEKEGRRGDRFDAKKEVKRLSKLGFLVNFDGADDDDDEEEDLTQEHRTRRASKRALQDDRPIVAGESDETPKAERLRTRNRDRIESEEAGRSAKAPTRKGSKASEEKVEAPDDGVGNDDL